MLSENKGKNFNLLCSLSYAKFLKQDLLHSIYGNLFLVLVNS